nr:immunoglobulin heavy chain junction region [Mus musculus]MBK4184485.1 immunoglobulin heavy chain junction region [Mus musculus]MBK4185087.1 immunoglobulin heavy chain junction region [Mus musculus]MBK4186167.1 immunoglobulin heavy chain junction region [Mus musculus]MBK4186570.1 immunoglobulin heavy chain junction region [Mus musculus]
CARSPYYYGSSLYFDYW